MRRDLSTLDRDIGQDWSRILQEAFAHGITNDMIFGGLVAGQTALQALNAIVATQNCRIGTRRITWDGMVYRYTAAEATLKTTFLCASSNKTQEVRYSPVTTGALAGENTIILTVDGGDGDGNGNIAKDYLKDGIICIDMGQVNSDALYQMRILSNTKVTGGGPMTIVVDGVFPLAVTDAMNVEAMASPYKGLVNEGLSARSSFMGLPQRAATALIPYSWILTWGPCWVTPANDTGEDHNPGAADYSAQLVARCNVSGGQVAIHDSGYGLTKYAQHVGFVISWSQANAQGAPFIMLQISK